MRLVSTKSRIHPDVVRMQRRGQHRWSRAEHHPVQFHALLDQVRDRRPRLVLVRGVEQDGTHPVLTEFLAQRFGGSFRGHVGGPHPRALRGQNRHQHGADAPASSDHEDVGPG